MSNRKSKTQAAPQAFLKFAREYYQAAEELHDSKSRIQNARYFLYFHSTELLLKAYLRAHNKETWGHEIGELYEECRTLGLKIESDDRTGLGNIVSLLESGNEEMGFRYFNSESDVLPDLDWTHRVVKQLLGVVANFVEPNGPTPPGPAVKFVVTVGMPVNKATA